MLLIDRSPGAFIALVNLVVYGVIGVEVWMWTVATPMAVVATMVLITAVAAVICRATLHLMGDEATPVPLPAVAPVPARTPRPSRLALHPVRVRVRGHGHGHGHAAV